MKQRRVQHPLQHVLHVTQVGHLSPLGLSSWPCGAFERSLRIRSSPSQAAGVLDFCLCDMRTHLQPRCEGVMYAGGENRQEDALARGVEYACIGNLCAV